MNALIETEQGGGTLRELNTRFKLGLVSPEDRQSIWVTEDADRHLAAKRNRDLFINDRAVANDRTVPAPKITFAAR